MVLAREARLMVLSRRRPNPVRQASRGAVVTDCLTGEGGVA